MSDVLKIAINRRDRLRAEINELNAFISFAEKLVADGGEMPSASGSSTKSSSALSLDSSSNVKALETRANGAG